jgi:hypothetical protein
MRSSLNSPGILLCRIWPAHRASGGLSGFLNGRSALSSPVVDAVAPGATGQRSKLRSSETPSQHDENRTWRGTGVSQHLRTTRTGVGLTVIRRAVPPLFDHQSQYLRARHSGPKYTNRACLLSQRRGGWLADDSTAKGAHALIATQPWRPRGQGYAILGLVLMAWVTA